MPAIVALAIEPVVGVLADQGRRRTLLLGGAAAFGLAVALIGAASGFWLLLLALLVAYPASGAFVGLAQTVLVDLSPDGQDRAMARWTLAGSIGVTIAPLGLAALLLAGGGWRAGFVLLALGTLVALPLARRLPAAAADEDGEEGGVLAGLRAAAGALRRREVRRWLTLLQLTNLLLDVLHGYLALYLVDVIGLSIRDAALAVSLWSAAGLAGDALLVVALRRVNGLTLLRASAGLIAVAYPAFLLAPSNGLRLVLLAVLGLATAGWYAVPQARLYAALPGRSGSAMALGTVGDAAGQLFPLVIGAVAAAAGLGAALWIPLVAPLALLLWLPRRSAE
jgi:FSR family fosmidomycin resistance protein-like MFS transporter